MTNTAKLVRHWALERVRGRKAEEMV